MRRPDQLAHALRDLAGRYLRERVDLPEGVFVTVTRAYVPAGRAVATIFLSVLPRERGAEMIQLLAPHLYDLQGMINTALSRRASPRVTLALEEGEVVGEKP